MFLFTITKQSRHLTFLLARILLCFCLLAMSGCNSKTKEELYAQGVKQLDSGDPGGAIIFFKNALDKDQNYYDARYKLAKAYFSAAKYEHAEKTFQAVFTQNPARQDIKLELARIYNITRRPELAIKEAREYIRLAGESLDALEVLGIAYAINDQPEEAEVSLRQTLKQDPTRTSARLELAALQITRNNEDEARQLLDEVIKADPQNSRAYYLLAGLEVSLGNRDKAIAIYRSIYALQKTDSQALYKAGILHLEKNDLVTADKAASELLGLFPRRGEGYRLRGIVLYYNKRHEEAIIELQRSIKAQPHIEGFYFLGLSLYERGELENALSQFNMILNKNPGYTRARLLTGIIFLRQRRVDDAVSQMRKLVSQAPRFALAHNILGSAYMAKGMYDEGMKEYNRAIELDPKLVDAYLKKGIFSLNRGREKEAETDLQTAIRIAPEIINTRMILASHYMRQKEFQKAVLLLQQGLTGKKIDAAIYNYMAAISLFQKKQAECEQFLQKAKEMDPDFFAAYFNLALYHAAAGRNDQAFTEFRAVLQRDPKNLKAMLNIAALLELVGSEKEALEQYEKALASGSETAYLALTHYYLKKKDTVKALTLLDKACDLLPRNPAILETKGQVLMGEKKYREAIRVFDDLESSNPDKGLPLKIKAYAMMGDAGKAEELARQIIALRPLSAYGYLTLASIYEYRNNLGRAIEELKNGIKADRENLQAHLILGNLLAKNKDSAAAMAAYQEALRINPDFAPAIFAEGALMESLGDKKGAMKKYLETLTKAENYLPALNNLAYLYVDGSGNVQEGLRMALSGFKLESENPVIMDTLGYALLKNGRSTEAQKILERTADLLPNNPTVAYHLALAYRQLDARDRAIAMLQKSLTLGDFPEAPQARQLLQELRR